MLKTVEINTSKLNNNDLLDLDFDISSYLIDLDIRHSVFSYDNKLEFLIDGIDIIIYNKFVAFLKSKDLDFKEA